MLTFLKRERGLRMLPASALLAIAFIALIGSSFDRVRDAFGEGGFVSVYFLVAIISLQSTLIGAARDFPFRVRFKDFERSLPVTMRRVVLERLGSVWLVLFGTFLAALVTRFAQSPSAVDLGYYGWMLVRGFLASGVTAALIFAYRPTRPELNTTEAGVVCIACIAAWLLSSASSSTVIDAAYLVALVGLIGFLCYALPVSAAPSLGSVRQVPKKAVESISGGAELGGPSSASLPVRLFGTLRWIILRGSILRPQIVLIGVAAVFYLWNGLGAHVMAIWLLGMFTCMALRMGLNVIYGIDSLPLHREKVLRVAGLTSLVFLVASMTLSAKADRELPPYGTVTWGVAVDNCREESLGEEHGRRIHVKVPASEWQVARDPADAVITSPWGESVTPTLHPIFPGAKTFIYNPYDVQPDSTGELLVWQVQRALDQVHGSAGRIDDRFLDWQDTVDRKLPISEGRIDDAESANWGFEVVEHSEAPNAAGFAAFSAWLIWFLTTCFALRPNVPSNRLPAWWSKLPHGTSAALLIGPFAIALYVWAQADSSLLPVLIEQAHAWMDIKLGSSPALWAALVIGLSGLSYAFLAWRIQRIEVPPLATNGWTKKALSIY